MFRKIIYTIWSFVVIIINLKNPLVLLGYFGKKPVRLDLKSGLKLWTWQLLDAIVIKETIIDDSYRVFSLKKPVNFIIDVGGAVGDSALFFAKKFTSAKVLVFEPLPDQYQLLLKNIKLNNLTNVIPYQLAVGTKKTHFLYLSPSHVHASTINNSRAVGEIKVGGTRLDKFVTGRVDLLKIDCEGAELDILQSITPAKMKLVKRIIVEYHNHIIPREDKKITGILKKYGFTVSQGKNPIVPTTGYVFGVK